MFFTPEIQKAEDEPQPCLTDVSQFASQEIPNYLQPWWNSVQKGYFVVAFVDFPDGRYINGTDTLQPFYDWQLEWVYNNGVIDAAAEMGLILEQTNIPTLCGNKFVKASKYTWYDRWNMFFDSVGSYVGTAHPDWASNGDSAWGSFKEYWKQASNSKFDLVPYLTHPNETNYKLRTGIVNDYVMINGQPIIKSIKMPKKKYGLNNFDSYFRNDSTLTTNVPTAIITDAKQAIEDQTDFDLTEFSNNTNGEGIIFFYFAGTHRAFIDGADNNTISPIRSRENNILHPDSKMDGFGVSCHQYGHMKFGWAHTRAGRCDIMNGHDVHDNNSPEFPNPVSRMKQGWLQPIALDRISLDTLPPIETSYKCGVVTIFGKPNASPDWSTGESFIIENRRRLNFDRKIVREDLLTDGFLGGMLVWHFSPYYIIDTSFSFEPHIKFLPADTSSFVISNRGRPKSFFAYAPLSITQDPKFYELDSGRTHSGSLLKSGIKLNNIDQLDYSNLNSNVKLNLNYVIAPPRNYSDLIFYRNIGNHMIEYSDTVFYHGRDPLGYFRFMPGTVIEYPGGNVSPLSFRAIEAIGTPNLPIKFMGIGYDSCKVTYKSFTLDNFSPYLSIDSVILKNIKFSNHTDSLVIRITHPSFDPSVAPINMGNIEFENGSNPLINIVNGIIANVNLSSSRIFFSNQAIFKGPVKVENCQLSFNGGSFKFDGGNASLSVSSNSNNTVYIQDSLSIVNGSYLIARGVNFEKSSNIYTGVLLENTGIDSILNCTFSNAKTALSIINYNAVSKYSSRIIKDNIFNVPSGGNYKAIYGENNYSMLVQNNRFNLPQTNSGSPFYSGLFLKNTSSSEPPEVAGEEGENETATNYSLNIVNNTFRKGSASLVLANYTSNFLPYYIKGNKFDSLNTNAATLNILGMNITGTIKDNVFTSMQTPMGVHLINSNPDFYNNFIGAKKVSLHLVGHSYPNLAPYISGDEMVWTGGKNRLSTDSMDNIQLAVQGNVFTDYGRNRFTILDNAYHIYGWIDSNVTTYYSRNNCWDVGGAAKIYLRLNAATPPIPTITYNYGLDCNSEPGPTGWDVDYMGNEIWDSTFKTEDESQSTPSTEEMLASQCEHYMNELQMYQEAITSLKSYIDDYPTGNYVKDAMNNLYSCYLYLDTSTSQSYRNTLFGNLINYAEEKVASNNYGEDFELVAGDVIAMCEANVLNYSNAMNWYEFIALYYPDPDIRLAASWNYAEIDALLNSGSGGGEKDLGLGNKDLGFGIEDLGFEERKEINEFSRLNKIINDNPLMRKMKKSFDKLSKNRKEKIEYDLKTILKDKRNLDRMIKKSNELDKLKQDKANRNIFESGMYSKEQADNNRMLDLMLTTRAIRNELESDNSSVIPLEYKLIQNYPNPFNPATTIEFESPIDGLVKLKVYDITGREVRILVNEFRSSGYHHVIFDGSNLSSGVYFYKLTSGIFEATKRMLLVK